MSRSRAPRRGFLLALAGVLVLVALLLAANQLLGGDTGAPCGDSYACRGLLLRGVECVQEDDRSYCTRYCRSDAQCPAGWSCLAANPTVLTIKTQALDKVCIQPAAGRPARR